MQNNKVLNFKHLLGFNQLETICDDSDNPQAIEYMGRLANKIGSETCGPHFPESLKAHLQTSK